MRGERGEERGVDGREKGKGGLLALASKNDMYILAGSLYQYIFKREMRRKEKRSKQGQTNNKAKQHRTPKAVPFPEKN